MQRGSAPAVTNRVRVPTRILHVDTSQMISNIKVKGGVDMYELRNGHEKHVLNANETVRVWNIESKELLDFNFPNFDLKELENALKNADFVWVIEKQEKDSKAPVVESIVNWHSDSGKIVTIVEEEN